jgi:hypothetical protein
MFGINVLHASCMGQGFLEEPTLFYLKDEGVIFFRNVEIKKRRYSASKSAS